jgi:intracellular sulfur oxidation DsrE/DsrF family protein
MKTAQLHCLKSMMTIVLLLSISGLAFADSDYYDESVPPQPKAFYDINLTNPESMVDFLWVIDETYNLLIRKGAPPAKIKFVVSLRGLSVKFAEKDFGLREGEEEYEDEGIQIREYLDSLLSKGVRIEACIISCLWVGTDPENLFDGIVVIDNAFASSIWYQTRGYALIPISQLP